MSNDAAQAVSRTRDFTVLNKYGIHARPAALFVKTTSRSDSEIMVEKGDIRVSGKSIMGLMTLEASKGTKLRVTVTGNDADDVLDALGRLFDNRFEVDGISDDDATA